MSDFERSGISAGDVNAPILVGEGPWTFRVISGKVRPGRNVEKGGPKKDFLYALEAIGAGDEVTTVFDTGLGDYRPIEAGDAEQCERVYHQIGIFDDRNYWDVKKFQKNILGMHSDVVDSNTLDIDDTAEFARGFTFKATVRHDWREGSDTPYVRLTSLARDN